MEKVYNHDKYIVSIKLKYLTSMIYQSICLLMNSYRQSKFKVINHYAFPKESCLDYLKSSQDQINNLFDYQLTDQ